MGGGRGISLRDDAAVVSAAGSDVVAVVDERLPPGVAEIGAGADVFATAEPDPDEDALAEIRDVVSQLKGVEWATERH